MAGSDEFGSETYPVVYCLVPRDLAPRLHEPLRRHFRDDPLVEVVVESRALTRRSGHDRRSRTTGAVPAPERRLIRNAEGRRVDERRATQVTAMPPSVLPRKARDHAQRLAFVERIEPSGQQREDSDTARIVTRIQAGDRDGFSVLYMRYFDRVYSYLRLVFRDAHEAEDAAQQVFVKMLEGLGGYEQRGGPFRGWLFVIARNHALTQLPRQARTQAAANIEQLRERDSDPQDAGDLSALDWLTDRDLFVFVERLPLSQRQVLFLRYVVGLSMAEVGGVLGQSPEAVRQQHARALRFLRQRLTSLGREPRTGNRIGAEIVFKMAPVLRMRRFSLIAPS